MSSTCLYAFVVFSKQCRNCMNSHTTQIDCIGSTFWNAHIYCNSCFLAHVLVKYALGLLKFQCRGSEGILLRLVANECRTDRRHFYSYSTYRFLTSLTSGAITTETVVDSAALQVGSQETQTSVPNNVLPLCSGKQVLLYNLCDLMQSTTARIVVIGNHFFKWNWADVNKLCQFKLCFRPNCKNSHRFYLFLCLPNTTALSKPNRETHINLPFSNKPRLDCSSW